MEVVFKGINWWGYSIYATKTGINIVNDGDNFYTLSDPNDIDSEPYQLLKKDSINIVDKF